MKFFAFGILLVTSCSIINSVSTFSFFDSMPKVITKFLGIKRSSTSAAQISRQHDGELNFVSQQDNIMEDARLLTSELIEKYGYPSEKHFVTTDDGYILEMHRIPKPGAQPVLLLHGILDTSATWVLMGPKFGLGYILSDLGYDVWMGNVRGNRYCQRNKYIKNSGREFWNFSFHEMGIFDLPKMIDHILDHTKYEKLHYIAHSQGTAVFWVMCSEKPEYNDKIISMHALAPIAFLSKIKSPVVRSMAVGVDVLEILSSLLGIGELLPNTKLFTNSTQSLCHDEAITQGVCSNSLFLIAGYSTNQLNKTMLPVILSHTPSGASVKQLVHFGQLVKSGHFRKFNHGYFRNAVVYGHTTPPDYNLQNVKVPVSLYYSLNDWMVDVAAVIKLGELLPNVIDVYLIPLRAFNHLDFVWAVDAKELVYDRVILNMRRLEHEEIATFLRNKSRNNIS